MRFRFDDFVLDLTRRALIENGETRHLSPKAFLLLELLVQNAPRAMSKDELYRHVWGDLFVEEANLPNLVSELRSILGDTRKQPKFLKTIHGFGYAFEGAVVEEAEPKARSSGPHRFTLQWRQEEFALKRGANVVGRGDDCDVLIASNAISRRHARVTVSREGATVEDLQSKNGTFVRGERITGATVLRDGDDLRLGYVDLTFREIDPTGTTVTTHD